MPGFSTHEEHKVLEPNSTLSSLVAYSRSGFLGLPERDRELLT